MLSFKVELASTKTKQPLSAWIPGLLILKVQGSLPPKVSKWLVAQCGCAVSVVCYQKVVANRPSLLTVYLPIQGSRAASQIKFSVVTEVSTFLIITQGSSDLKKNCIFSFCIKVPSCHDGHCKILCHPRSNSLGASLITGLEYGTE